MGTGGGFYVTITNTIMVGFGKQVMPGDMI
jgi:hypothetical protein